MPAIGLTRAGILTPIVAYLERIGAPVERLLAESGLPDWVVTKPETLIPTSVAPRLLTLSARAQGVEALGLLAGEATSIESLGVFGKLVRSAPTLGAALETLVRHHPTFSSNGRMWIARHGDRVEVCQAFVKHFDDSWQQASHYILMLMLGIVRLAAGPTWRPREVRLQTGECRAILDCKALSGAHLTFSQPETAIVLPRALLDAPIHQSRTIAPASGLGEWEASAPAGNFVDSVAQIVKTLSWDGYPDIHRTADTLHMSVRTLQRRLAERGQTHEALVDRVRFASAATLLEETDTKIIDVALDLGYSDPAHFTRAFRRWAGCCPQEFRRRHKVDVVERRH